MFDAVFADSDTLAGKFGTAFESEPDRSEPQSEPQSETRPSVQQQEAEAERGEILDQTEDRKRPEQPSESEERHE
jgi:hypothetical protein